jgi:hypothetical protein
MNLHHQIHRLKVRKAAKVLAKAERAMRDNPRLDNVATFAHASSAHYVAKYGRIG